MSFKNTMLFGSLISTLSLVHYKLKNKSIEHLVRPKRQYSVKVWGKIVLLKTWVPFGGEDVNSPKAPKLMYTRGK